HTAWLAGLWPGAAPGAADAPAALVERLGPTDDPRGGTAAGPTASGDDDATAEPQLGSVLDPDG
ncbi:MAG TPA: hypothetical protein VLF66_07680, partial [Thermoanaerobaculia bacterium]|nr:hypothetical protein [Thermoanaerobaculia bacterium]